MEAIALDGDALKAVAGVDRILNAVHDLDNWLDLLDASYGDVRCANRANRSKHGVLEVHRMLHRTGHFQLKLK